MAKNDTKIRRITAKDSSKKTSKTEAKPAISKYRAKVEGIETKKTKKALPKWLQIVLLPFKLVGKILAFVFKPFRKIFAPIGKYFAESWQELKLVRWPTRKETWKMTVAVLIFSITFVILVVLLDGLFNWIFTTILGK